MNEGKKSCVYIGPSRPFDLPVMRNAILAGEPEEVLPDLKASFREHENFRKLFVSVGDLGAARAALKKPGSALQLINQEIEKASAVFKAGRKEK